jgi:hypothetical protein
MTLAPIRKACLLEGGHLDGSRVEAVSAQAAEMGMPSVPPELGQDGTEDLEALLQRIGQPARLQIAIWRMMSPTRRLELAFQAYQFALDAVRVTERQRHPDLPAYELTWRVTRRMQGDPRLGK